MRLQEVGHRVPARPLVVDAPVPGGADTGQNGHTLGCGVIGHALGVFRPPVRIAQESPDHDAPDAKTLRKVRQPSVVLQERVRVLVIPVVAAARLDAGIVEAPVAAMVPSPEIRRRQSGPAVVRELPRVVIARPGVSLANVNPHILPLLSEPYRQLPTGKSEIPAIQTSAERNAKRINVNARGPPFRTRDHSRFTWFTAKGWTAQARAIPKHAFVVSPRPWAVVDSDARSIHRGDIQRIQNAPFVREPQPRSFGRLAWHS
jgi:hypothetical protein